MSHYTSEIRFICEYLAGLKNSVGYNNVSDVIQKARPKIFNFPYPIFDEKYKPVLETKILKHYYTREIGLETYGLWQLKLDTKLNEIMPYYNKLYQSELLKFNPLEDTAVKTEYNLNVKTDSQNTANTNSNQKATGNSTQKQEHDNTASSKVKDKYSDTPQSTINNLENDTYLTNARMTDNNTIDNGKTTTESNMTNNADATSTQKGTQNINTINDYISNVTGKRGGESYSDLLLKFRETFLNIDNMILEELSELFMLIY